MSTCSCSLAGTAACKYCTNNPDAIRPPVVRSFTVSASDRVLWVKTTNADRIRAMTDEELAEFISGKARTFGEEYEGYMSALDWLKQEVEE